MRKKVTVRNKLQSYTYYLTESVGKKFDKEFKPDLSPKQMLKLGVFGGDYFLGYDGDIPKGWFKGVKLSDHGKDGKYNFFGLSASQPWSVWKKKGWINKKHDPLGWFQWYCRYYFGRRLPEEDARQIKRWKGIFRHVSQVKKSCRKGDSNCRRKQRQAILHWAIDSRKL